MQTTLEENKMSVTSCPQCGSTNIFYDAIKEEHECLSCGHKWGKTWETTAYEALEKMEPTKPISEAVVRVEEIPTFTPAFLSTVEEAWRSKSVQTYWDWICEPTAEGVTVTLRGTTKPHEFFPRDIIERMKYDPVREHYYVPRTESPGIYRGEVP